MKQVTNSHATTPAGVKPTRDLFVRGVPQDIWDRIHINAIRSGLRLKHYLIQILDSAEPFLIDKSDR